MKLDHEFHLVIQDGSQKPYFTEADAEGSTEEQILQDLMSGQYDAPLAVVRFNPGEKTSADISKAIAEMWLEHILENWTFETKIPAFVSFYIPTAEDQLLRAQWEDKRDSRPYERLTSHEMGLVAGAV